MENVGRQSFNFMRVFGWLFLLGFLFLCVVLPSIYSPLRLIKSLTYNEFLRLVDIGAVEKVKFINKEIRGVISYGKRHELFVTHVPPGEDLLMIHLLRKGVRIEQAKITYKDFISLVEAGYVKEVNFCENVLKGVVWCQGGDKVYVSEFSSYVPYIDNALIPKLLNAGVDVHGDAPPTPSWWQNAFVSIGVPFLLMFFFFWLLSRARGPTKLFSFGHSKAKLMTKEQVNVTFDSVAGINEAKEELKEVIEFLKNPKRFQKLGARIPKGILLVGPPGTGKTLLAKAVAGESNVKFFSISGSDFVELFVGVGASRVRDLFEQAKRNSPSIIFIDEIDAVGRQRGAGIGGGHDEREQTLNQLLVEMDGFDTSSGVILIAATNRPDVLDAALLRPGRFDRHIVVDCPDLLGRKEILKVHAKNKPLADDVDFDILARRTVGFVGSDLANLINEAAILAARKGKDKISMSEFDESIDRVIAGPQRKSRIISERERKIVAYHESGHALIAKTLPNADPVHKISINPRGLGLGYTLQLPTEDRYILSYSELLSRITVLLGGQVAEELILGEVTTGAENDLKKATELAHKMVCRYGMSKKLGPMTFGRTESNIFLGRDLVKERNFSEEVAANIDAEVGRIMKDCYENAKKILTDNREKLDRLAQRLMQEEVLDSEQIDKILKCEVKDTIDQ